MLFLHEVHQVVGYQEDEFEAAFRDGWMPTLAKDDDARLLWYANHAVGSGVSYRWSRSPRSATARRGSSLARRIQQRRPPGLDARRRRSCATR